VDNPTIQAQRLYHGICQIMDRLAGCDGGCNFQSLQIDMALLG
jgi:hypothetical protein